MNQLYDRGEINDDTLLFNHTTGAWEKVSDILGIKTMESTAEEPTVEEVNIAEPQRFVQENGYHAPQKAKKKSFVIPLIISLVVVFILGGIFVAYIFKASVENRQKQKLAEQEIVMLVQDSMNGKEIKVKDYPESKYGKNSEMLKFFNEFYRKLQGIRKQMESDMVNIGLDKMLTREVLEDPAAIAKAREDVERLASDMGNYEESIKQIFKDFTEKADSMDMPRTFKRDFLDALKKSNAASIESLSDFYNIEESIMVTIAKILEFAQNNEEEYVFEGDQIMFYSQEDIDQYNQLIDELQAGVKKEEEWKAKQMKKINDELNQLKK